VVAEEALEVIVVAGALGAAEAQEGSAVVVAVAADLVAGDLGEAVVVSEVHDIVFKYVKDEGKNLERSSEDMCALTSSSSRYHPSRNHPRSSRPWFTW
jgi:hypothetical protein